MVVYRNLETTLPTRWVSLNKMQWWLILMNRLNYKIPTHSHSWLLTYWRLFRTPWRHFFNTQDTSLASFFDMKNSTPLLSVFCLMLQIKTHPDQASICDEFEWECVEDTSEKKDEREMNINFYLWLLDTMGFVIRTVEVILSGVTHYYGHLLHDTL